MHCVKTCCGSCVLTCVKQNFCPDVTGKPAEGTCIFFLASLQPKALPDVTQTHLNYGTDILHGQFATLIAGVVDRVCVDGTESCQFCNLEWFSAQSRLSLGVHCVAVCEREAMDGGGGVDGCDDCTCEGGSNGLLP